jgi:hypothetical protein
MMLKRLVAFLLFALSAFALVLVLPSGKAKADPCFTFVYGLPATICGPPSGSSPTPTPSPSPTIYAQFGTPYPGRYAFQINGASPTPYATTIATQPGYTTIYLSARCAANTAGNELMIYVNGWSFNGGHTDGATNPTDSTAYKLFGTGSGGQALPSTGLPADTDLELFGSFTPNGISVQACPRGGTCGTATTATSYTSALTYTGNQVYIGAANANTPPTRLAQCDIWDVGLANGVIGPTQQGAIFSGMRADPYPTPTPAVVIGPIALSTSSVAFVGTYSNGTADQTVSYNDPNNNVSMTATSADTTKVSVTSVSGTSSGNIVLRAVGVITGTPVPVVVSDSISARNQTISVTVSPTPTPAPMPTITPWFVIPLPYGNYAPYNGITPQPYETAIAPVATPTYASIYATVKCQPNSGNESEVAAMIGTGSTITNVWSLDGGLTNNTSPNTTTKMYNTASGASAIAPQPLTDGITYFVSGTQGLTGTTPTLLYLSCEIAPTPDSCGNTASGNSTGFTFAGTPTLVVGAAISPGGVVTRTAACDIWNVSYSPPQSVAQLTALAAAATAADPYPTQTPAPPAVSLVMPPTFYFQGNSPLHHTVAALLAYSAHPAATVSPSNTITYNFFEANNGANTGTGHTGSYQIRDYTNTPVYTAQSVVTTTWTPYYPIWCPGYQSGDPPCNVSVPPAPGYPGSNAPVYFPQGGAGKPECTFPGVPSSCNFDFHVSSADYVANQGEMDLWGDTGPLPSDQWSRSPSTGLGGTSTDPFCTVKSDNLAHCDGACNTQNYPTGSTNPTGLQMGCANGGYFPFSQEQCPTSPSQPNCASGIAQDQVSQYNKGVAAGFAYELYQITAEDLYNAVDATSTIPIKHALGLSIPCVNYYSNGNSSTGTLRGAVYPAAGVNDSWCTQATDSSPNMRYGQLIAIKPTITLSTYYPWAKMSGYCHAILTALQTYGAYPVEVSGSALSIQYQNYYSASASEQAEWNTVWSIMKSTHDTTSGDCPMNGGSCVAEGQYYVTNSPANGACITGNSAGMCFETDMCLQYLNPSNDFIAVQLDQGGTANLPTPEPNPYYPGTGTSCSPSGPQGYPLYSACFTGNSAFHHTVAALETACSCSALSNSATIMANFWSNNYHQGYSSGGTPYFTGSITSTTGDPGPLYTRPFNVTYPSYTLACPTFGTCNASGKLIYLASGAVPETGSDHHVAMLDLPNAQEIDMWGGDTVTPANDCVLTAGSPGTAKCSWGGYFPFSGDGTANGTAGSQTNGMAAIGGNMAEGITNITAQDLINAANGIPIGHALSIDAGCVDASASGVYPSLHNADASCATGGGAQIVYGDLIRLKSSVTISSLTNGSNHPGTYCTAILTAFQKYGAYVSDTNYNNGTGYGANLHTEYPSSYSVSPYSVGVAPYNTNPWTAIIATMNSQGDAASGTWSSCLNYVGPSTNLEVIQILGPQSALPTQVPYGTNG